MGFQAKAHCYVPYCASELNTFLYINTEIGTAILFIVAQCLKF